jgi:hypothetical protein
MNQAATQATTTRDIIAQVIATIPITPAPVVNRNRSSSVTQSMKLTQRQIKHFKGEVLEWTQFWESFNAMIHSSTLTNVQKFDYLKEYLKGVAHFIVNNLELTGQTQHLEVQFRIPNVPAIKTKKL